MLWYVWLIMLITGSVEFFISIILLFVFHVPDLLDELSGRKARRQIKRLRELNLGTGALEGIATEDVYSSLPTGSMFSESISSNDIVNSEGIECQIKNIVSEDDESNSTTSMEHEEQDTSYIDRETDFMGEVSTNYIDNEDATNMLSDIESHKQRVVEVIEEQTSIKEGLI